MNGFRHWYATTVLTVVVILVAVFAVVYSDSRANRAERAAEQASSAEIRVLCPIFVTLDNVYKQTPPTTATGRNFAAKMHDVVVRLGCELA